MGRFGLNSAMILKVMIIFIIAIFIIRLIIQHLINSNKIKPCKISRLFYLDDEKFIKSWEKERDRGKLKFVLYYNAEISIAIWVTSLIVIVATDGDFSKLENTLPVFFGFLIGSTIGYPLRWNKNEKKYNELTKNIE